MDVFKLIFSFLPSILIASLFVFRVSNELVVSKICLGEAF